MTIKLQTQALATLKEQEKAAWKEYQRVKAVAWEYEHVVVAAREKYNQLWRECERGILEGER